MSEATSHDTLARLAEVLEARKGAAADSSYVASLYHKGLNKILENVGEESVETILAAKDAAVSGDCSELISTVEQPFDISTTTGNAQLAQELTKNGPVMRSEIELERDPSSVDGYRWTLSGGSGVFPIREGLTVSTHAYVEWRSPISYVIPGLRSLTGGFRTPWIDLRWNQPSLRQPNTVP